MFNFKAWSNQTSLYKVDYQDSTGLSKNIMGEVHKP